MGKKIDDVFWAADRNMKCNTAYPIYKNAFKKYESNLDVMHGVSELSYYIHIPFCKHLCKFCEYTRFLSGNKGQEDKYLELLELQIIEFVNKHKIDKVFGLDVGGGTPSALDDDNFERVLKLANYLLNGDLEKGIARPLKADDFENSIEISFNSINQKKISMIGEYGFKRVSAGIQSMNSTLLNEQNREINKINDISAYMKALHDAGVEKINFDLMYGMPGQTENMIYDTLDAIEVLCPEQVTLYEMRYNRMKTKPEDVNRNLMYDQYNLLYERLIYMGYSGYFGKNTFTRSNDHGVSSYIWYRMDKGIPYKGFGISSQSMGFNGISYGSLKNSELKAIPKMESIRLSSNYFLPNYEMAAKYVSIAMYNGCFRLDVLSRILGKDSKKYYAEELSYLLDNRYITIIDNYVKVTEKGFRYYGAITALFWSDDQKMLLLSCEEGKKGEI